MERIRAEIRGIVQGVGFRPFVYGLAGKYGLAGFVRNTSFGALLEVEGSSEAITSFLTSMQQEAPPLARITEIISSDRPVSGQSDFIIEHSQAQQRRSALISPDVAVCEDCLREMLDPADRRYGYPFINCTNCGPRYTIIMDLPYDRIKTSMRVFEMCPECAAEYHDPDDRRFHAQPNACQVCGPTVSLLDAAGSPVQTSDVLGQASDLLSQGLILAVKGLGGFHLAVDARNQEAVLRLRRRKRREEKPLAVMSPRVEDISTYALIDADERAVLTSIQRPIVLLTKRRPFPLAPAVAPDNKYIGAMLPYTPLHHLLLKGFQALVMTSGNLIEEPIAIDNNEALKRLEGLADYFLVHNRDIYLRTDDSVVRAGPDGAAHIRRSRGFVPAPVFLKQPLPPILALGGELKNTVCLIKEDRAFVSQHIGDLENLSTLEFFELTVEHLKRILDIEPAVLACDRHPDYLSSRWGRSQTGLELIEVQHHHAHVASALAEHHLEGPVIGLSCDGTGYGDDGQIWGGEVLAADLKDYQRLGHLDYIPLPSGAAAIKEPWRMAVSYLESAFGSEAENLDLDFWSRRDPAQSSLLMQIVRQRIASPLTSSLGRLFDAVAALIGLKERTAFEGQAAMMLEMICPKGDFVPYPFDVDSRGEELIIKPQALIRQIVEDIRGAVPPEEISGRFHAAVVGFLTEITQKAARRTGLSQVVLSGGCFQNRILTEHLTGALEARGFKVQTQKQVPVNDGGLSLGQAVCAGMRMIA